MTTVNAKPLAGAASRRPTRLWRASVTAVGAALALAACAPGYETYVEGYWDNGDPFTPPSKTELFDENGIATCEFPVKYNRFESRATPNNVVRGFLVEVMNQELDPDGPLTPGLNAEQEARERLRRERMLDSLPVLWQYTSLSFDAANGISTPEDLAPIKAEIQAHLPGVGEGRPMNDFFKPQSEYFTTPEGRYDLVRLNDPRGYIESNDLDLEFLGLLFTYQTARKDGQEWLAVTNKESGEILMYRGSDEPFELVDSVYHATYYVYLDPDTISETWPSAEIEIVSDGCGESGGQPFTRYYVSGYELLDKPEDWVDEVPGEEGEEDNGFAAPDLG